MKPIWKKLAAAAKVKLSPDEQNKLWQVLGSDDAGQAYRAGNRLIRAGNSTVTFLHGALRPAPKLDPKKVKKWIGDLDNKRFAIRAKASAHLEKAGELAIGPMRQALKKNVTLEVRLRLQKILHTLESKPLLAAALRAVRVLERIGSADAQRLLQNLSQGQPGARLTEYARRSLLWWQ